MFRQLLDWLVPGRTPRQPPNPPATGEADPTAGWTALPALPLKLHLPAGILNDSISLGDHYRVLSRLGRPGNPRPYAADRFQYPSIGLTVEGTRGRIEYFEFIIGPEAWESAVTPARVILEFPDGQQLRLDTQTDEATLTAYFGPPLERDADEDEIIVRHELDGRLLDWELTPQGNVKRLHVELPLPPPASTG